jgi:hypothetical protein
VIEDIQKHGPVYGSTSSVTGSLQNSACNDDDDEERHVGSPLLTNRQSSKRSSSPWLIHLAINVSFIANIILFLTKVFLAVFSGSMALLASAFESFLDILSNAIIFFTVRVIRQRNTYDYPVGKVICVKRYHVY